MDCSNYQELLSARLDGEEPPDAARLDAHLDACADCSAWYDRAARITRLARTGVAEAGPDLVAAVLAELPPRRGVSLLAVLRWALGLLGIAQVTLAMSVFLSPGGGDHHGGGLLAAGATHLSHESAAWNLALGVAFGWAALRTRQVAGLVPVLGTFVVVLFGVSLLDLVRGGVAPTRVAAHLVALAGLVLIVLLARFGDSRHRPAPADRADYEEYDNPHGPLFPVSDIPRLNPGRPGAASARDRQHVA
ncbi:MULTISPECIES: zf-HC2 domain-containing protein [unclassified Crossiella]|uniref:zf-HC2 domain-containing protein n=1 Tax=unclassified Crossiella TaxID=2620835 RepID=UPI001FFFB4E9|nr:MULTISPECIES: zf-HC2 domain-containing protein [unclassified Crossiella]MCK2243311.1 zf-HC2 domain-containing protein [Crossiella sp. S99.2]MCK2254220.1 zf-HC2 domain-containing protein [Crossiella sp. S99.1]